MENEEAVLTLIENYTALLQFQVAFSFQNQDESIVNPAIENKYISKNGTNLAIVAKPPEVSEGA